ncbi:MAG: hypothetical protein AB7G28_22600 [Pirellulales bacterium]
MARLHDMMDDRNNADLRQSGRRLLGQAGRALFWRYAGFAALSAILFTPASAQTPRSAWMWFSPEHPFGSANVIGDETRERELIANFKYWGFDRVYASADSWIISAPNKPASWNASLDDAGISSQMLLGLIDYSPSQMANLVKTRLVNFNNSRTDSRERFDAVHLDLEPHGRSGWLSATPAARRTILGQLRDTYAAVRAELDNNGCDYVKMYADLPVWFDNLDGSLGWADAADRNQWFDDISESLDGFSMMAYERNTRFSIIDGVGWEVANFDGEVRIGLNVAEVGPGQTFASFAALMKMAEAIEAHYGTSIGGIDFHEVTTFSDSAAPRPLGDFNYDGVIDAADYTVWRDSIGSTTHLDADGDFDGVVGVLDYELLKSNFGSTAGGSSWTTLGATVPEPTSLLLCGAGLVALLAWPIRRVRDAFET